MNRGRDKGDLFEEYWASIHFGATRRETNRRRYGSEELRGNRAALPGMLDHFGIYPWKVMLITEGKGDVAMLEAIVSHHTAGSSFEALGIASHVMGAPKQKDWRVQELLGALWRFPNYFFLVFDNEGTAAEWIAQLERYKPDQAPFAGVPLLEPEPEATEAQLLEGWSGDSYRPKRRPGAEVWKEDIEADNFSEEEICEVIRQLADRDERVGDFTLTADDLREARGGSKKAVAEVAKNLAEERGFRFKKPVLDAELGRYAVEHPSHDGATRRVLILAEHLYRLTVAHRQMRGRLREREREALERSDSDTA